MTFKYDNVYINDSSTVAGPYEKNGPFGNLYDKTYKEFYFNEKTFEQAESKLINESVDILLNKSNKKADDIDVHISGDLLNQICATSYGAAYYNRPFLGVFSACATSMESIIVASSFLENNYISSAICFTSSHNLASEKQFRNPIEYGYTKPKTATFTSTGAGAIMLTNEKSDVKISDFTVGRIVDLKQNDPNNMGAVMAPAAADTIFNHLKNLEITPDYYDLILTGDLGIYGKEILKDYMKQKYNITLENYNDCGAMLYDLENQKEITAGGSGPVCSCLVNYGYIYNMLKNKKLNKVLMVTTGALFSPTFLYQKENILGIAHAVSMEVVK